MGKHTAPSPRRAPWLTVLTVLAAALVPATGSGAAPDAGQCALAHMSSCAPEPITAPASAVLTFERPRVATTPAPPRFTGMGLADFISRYTGRAVILPGYTTAECVAVFSHYNAEAVLGDAYSAPGAQDLWLTNTWTAYDRVPATEPAKRGDVVVWSGSFGAYLGGGYGHVAIVLSDNGATLTTLSQNPNPTGVLELSKYGVLGYLRPHHLNP